MFDPGIEIGSAFRSDLAGDGLADECANLAAQRTGQDGPDQCPPGGTAFPTVVLATARARSWTVT
jgi:hypothetical protein